MKHEGTANRPDARPGTGGGIPSPRRRWLVGAGAFAGLTLSRLAFGQAQVDEEDVSPAEDLMREHGVLKRILLVYGEAIRRIDASQELPPDAVRDGATIIRTFIEDYHEKLEEDHLFPRFEKARRLTDLTGVLRAQHQAGRRITDRIIQLSTPQTLKAPQAATALRDLLHGFTRMYEPHAAREDTVLFPAFRTIVSKGEYGALGEEFEKREHQLFGADGFETVVGRVAAIEKRLGIYDLGQFTPKAP
jgi:hemerythrin-like domain-containing protein